MNCGDQLGSRPSSFNICGKRKELFKRSVRTSRREGPPASNFQYQSAKTTILVIQRAMAARSKAMGGSRCCGMSLISQTSEVIMPTVMAPLAMTTRGLVMWKSPRRFDTAMGTIKTKITASNPQPGPTDSRSGSEKYTPPAASIATKAGQRGSGSREGAIRLWRVARLECITDFVAAQNSYAL